MIFKASESINEFYLFECLTNEYYCIFGLLKYLRIILKGGLKFDLDQICWISPLFVVNPIIPLYT